MRIIVPMAGLGKRMRPHTLTTTKAMIPIAGKSIVQRLVEYLAGISEEKMDHVAFVVGNFGKEAEDHLACIAETIGANSSIHYQHSRSEQRMRSFVQRNI